MSLETPIVLIIFNRPELTERVLAVIAAMRPRQMFVVADGPRPGRPGDAERVAATRALIDRIDWPCDLRKHYSAENLGCRRRYRSGLDWVFQNVEQAIVLEDDCLPDPTFFPFCEELLRRYHDDERVVAILGNNSQYGRTGSTSSYFFSKYFEPWGMATWRRVWNEFDPEMSNWPVFLAQGMHSRADSPEEEAYFAQVFDNTYRGLTDSFSYAFQYYCWRRCGLTIIPDSNLISNIGFGPDSTHTTSAEDSRSNVPLRPMGPLRHPPFVVRHKEADRFAFRRSQGLEEVERAPEASGVAVHGSPSSERDARLYQLEMRVLRQTVQLEEKEGVIQQQHQDIMRLHQQLQQKEGVIQQQHQDIMRLQRQPQQKNGVIQQQHQYIKRLHARIANWGWIRRAFRRIPTDAPFPPAGCRAEVHEKTRIVPEQTLRGFSGQGVSDTSIATPPPTDRGTPGAIPAGLRPLLLARAVVLGAAQTYYPGWYSTDQDVLDVTRRDDFARFWQPGTREAFLAEHLWEHLTEEEGLQALANCFEFLRPGGMLRIAVPDGFHPDPAYREAVRPGGSGPGAEDHKILYDFRSLPANLRAAGFQVRLLEYWDESGEFHREPWSSEDGHVRRSAHHDRRNQLRPLSFTSLIVDGIKTPL